MSPERLVPGITKYPDLAQQLDYKMRRYSRRDCSTCDVAKLAEDFKRRIRILDEDARRDNHRKTF